MSATNVGAWILGSLFIRTAGMAAGLPLLAPGLKDALLIIFLVFIR